MTSGHRRLAILLGALTATGPLAIDMYLPAFPAMATGLRAEPAEIQRTLATFFLGMALGQLMHGPLADRLGRRAPLIGGLALYAAASAACALVDTAGQLAALRFLQAVGGCAGVVVARAVVRDLFEEREAVRMMSAMMLAMGAAPILAPMLGGALLGLAGWRAIFGLLALYGAALALIAWKGLPESLPPSRRRQDGPLAVLVTYGSILRDRRFLSRILAGAATMGGLFAYLAGSPFVVMELHGLSPGMYGLVFGANAAGLIGMSQVAARLVRRHAPAILLRRMLAGSALSGLLVLGAAASGLGGLAGILVPLGAYIALLGAVLPLASALAMAPMGRAAGSASALIGSIQFGTGALAGLALGLLGNGTAVPMAALVACGGLAGLAVDRWLDRG